MSKGEHIRIFDIFIYQSKDLNELILKITIFMYENALLKSYRSAKFEFFQWI